jgi:hypothetical protein
MADDLGTVTSAIVAVELTGSVLPAADGHTEETSEA